MPKSSLSFNPSEYALVATRITLFYERHPTGRIITELVSRDRDVLFKALVYRSAEDREPAATGWALEREGDGEINSVACVENTETSAIGRALANLGFTASPKRASREEMEKADRARATLYKPSEGVRAARVAEGATLADYSQTAKTRSDSYTASRSDQGADLMELILEAGNRGMPASFLGRLEQRVADPDATADELLEIERRVRYWLLNRANPVAKKPRPPEAPPPDVNSPHQ